LNHFYDGVYHAIEKTKYSGGCETTGEHIADQNG
jgi:hypothetical protein